MIDATTYLPTVTWVTIVRDVVRISEYSYQFTAVPSDPYEPGAGQKEVGYVIIDYIGNIYSITNANESVVQVEDVMKCGWCPQIGRNAIISKQVGNSLFLSPIHYEYLDKQAFGKMYGINLSELWNSNKGDNGRLKNLISRNVKIWFKKTYPEPPVGKIKVYRMTEEVQGKPVMKDVLFYSPVIAKDCFSLVIDETEPLLGIIVEWMFNTAMEGEYSLITMDTTLYTADNNLITI